MSMTEGIEFGPFATAAKSTKSPVSKSTKGLPNNRKDPKEAHHHQPHHVLLRVNLVNFQPHAALGLVTYSEILLCARDLNLLSFYISSLMISVPQGEMVVCIEES